MKDLVLGTGDILDQTVIPGVVFIDGKDATVSYKDYENPGPNNELYLAKGQGISFKLTATTVPVSTQIGVKMAIGTDGVIKHGAHDFLHVRGAANMFYPMDHITWKPVTNENGEVAYYETPVITFSHSDRDYFHDTSSVISFTGFKFTFEEDDVMVIPTVDSETIEMGIAMMTMLYSAKAPEGNDGDETEPAPPVVEPLPDDGDGQPPIDNVDQPNEEQTTEDEDGDETEPVTDSDQTSAETDGEDPTEDPTEDLTEDPTEDPTEGPTEGLAGCGSVIGTGSLAAIVMLAAYALVGRKRS
jgi:hypothetical protein